MKIIFFNRFFHPDASATSQIVSDLAFDLARTGAEVHVVASRVPGGETPYEIVRGVAIHRVASAPRGPHGLARRAAAYGAYYLGSRRAARALVSPGDVVVVKTDPPLLSSVIGPIARRRHARFLIWLQDVFPEVAHEFGVPAMGGPVGATLRRIRNRSLVDANAVVAICGSMAARVRALDCVDADRLHVIHNWADGEAIVPLDPSANDARHRWNLGNAFVVGYSGNLGRVHEFDTLLAAAKVLRDDSGIRFLIVGGGPRWEEVHAHARKEGLTNVQFEPHQQRARLGEALGAADLHVSVLRPEFEGLVHPSKLYGIMAAARPTVFIGDVHGETASILAATGSGLSVATGDVDGLVREIRRLRGDRSESAAMGGRARKAFDETYSMPLALARWRTLLDKIARGP